MNTLTSLQNKANTQQKTMNDLMQLHFLLREDYKRINRHRKEHKQGLQDAHTKYKSVNEHIDALNRILKSKLKEIKENMQEIDNIYNRLQTTYMYLDAENDIKIDAEQSYNEVMQELRGE
jgi:chromosome segregation ATPase